MRCRRIDLTSANTGTSLGGNSTHQYDPMGNITRLTLGTTRTASFSYSGTTPKLTSVTENGIARSVSYDAAGNEIEVGSTTSTYSARNHLLASEGLTYGHDGRGIRTITAVGGTFGASLPASEILAERGSGGAGTDEEPADPSVDGTEAAAPGRVTRAMRWVRRLFTRGSLNFSVDADIIAQSAFTLPPTGTKKVNIYLPELQLMTESEFTTSTPNPEWDYIWFADQPLAQINVATGTTRWSFNDHLETPVLQTDATGAVVWRLELEPYGEAFAQRAGSTEYQPLRFPGQEDGVEGEKYYNVFRWYRGAWGRYTQADPIGIRGSLNAFGYGNQAPVVNTDRLGLWALDKSCKGFEATITAAMTSAVAGIAGCGLLCSDSAKLLDELMDATIKCDLNDVEHCGTNPPGSSITLGAPALAQSKQCPCMEALLAHEAAHGALQSWWDSSEGIPEIIENRCFGCGNDDDNLGPPSIGPKYLTRCHLIRVESIICFTFLLMGCSQNCDFAEKNGDWEFRGEAKLTKRGVFCDSGLYYDSGRLVAGSLLVTPLGTFEELVMSEHGDSPSGWRRIGNQTTSDIPIAGPPLLPVELEQGFYRSDGGSRRPGTPASWAFLGQVKNPGWVAPSNLRDVEFLSKHPYQRP